MRIQEEQNTKSLNYIKQTVVSIDQDEKYTNVSGNIRPFCEKKWSVWDRGKLSAVTLPLQILQHTIKSAKRSLSDICKIKKTERSTTELTIFLFEII